MTKKYQPAGIGMVPSQTELGSFIRSRRLELDLRQVPLAKQAGLTQHFVSMLEMGTRKYLNEPHLEKLAKALQCDPEELRKRMPKKHIAQPETELRKLIRSRREELGLTLGGFAKKMRMTRQQAKALEVRKNPGIRYELVRPLASALNLEPSVFAKFMGWNRRPTSNELGRLVRTRRKELTMSTGQLAEKLEVSRQHVSQIECGQCRLQNDDIIKQLAKVLNVDVNELQAVRPTRKLRQTSVPRPPLGKFLSTRRSELHLTQREVSECAETTAIVVSNLETGRILHPTPSLLDKMAKALDCQILPELIPPSQERNNGRKSPGFRKERKTALGKFVTMRRLELNLSQTQVARRADTYSAVVSGIERGTYHPGRLMLEKISKALGCEIPTDLIPRPKPRGPRARLAYTTTRKS